MHQPSRRAVLCTAAGLAGAAGCLARGPGGATPTGSAESTTEPPTATATPGDRSDGTAPLGAELTVDGTRVAVADAAVRDSLLYLDSPDSMAVAAAEGRRYLLVTVSGTESGPPPSSFALAAAGERYPARPDLLGGPFRIVDRGPTYDPAFGTTEGWVAFRVPPALDASTAQVVVDAGGAEAAWRLDDAARDALGRPRARFELRAVDLPERVPRDGGVTARVEAANVSDAAGTFRGVLNVAGLVAAYAPHPFTLDATPGETVAWERRFDGRPADGADSVGFYLDTAAGDRSVEAAVGDGSSAVTTTGQ